MSVCFLPYMPPTIAMWPSQGSNASNGSHTSTPASARSLPTCRASSGTAFNFSPTSSPVAKQQQQHFGQTQQYQPQQSPLYSQQPSPTPSQRSSSSYGRPSCSSASQATSPLSWKDYPILSNTQQTSHTSLSSLPSLPSSSPTRSTTAPVQYTPEKMHIYSGDLSPLEQCRLRTWPLREWIYRHRSNPYPTKADKRMLAKQANLREDQVNMWFANTRRRIKKVGMKTWSGGVYEDFNTKPASDIAEGSLSHSYAQTSDGCPSDDDSFLSGGSTGSDIVLNQF